MEIKVYIDIFGRVGVCENFPDTEENQGLPELLKELAIDENFYGDTYKEKPGFYMAKMSMDDDEGNGSPDYDVWLQIDKLTPFKG